MRLRFIYATDIDIQAIGRDLEFLVRLRNDADYHLAIPDRFRSADEASRVAVKSRDAIARLDALEADPTRRA